MKTFRVGLIGDFNPQVTAHDAIPKALALAAQAVGAPVADPARTEESATSSAGDRPDHSCTCTMKSPTARKAGTDRYP